MLPTKIRRHHQRILTIAIDTPDGNLSLFRYIKALTTALNRPITYLNRTNFSKKYLVKPTFRRYTCNILRAIKVLRYVQKFYTKRRLYIRLQQMVKGLK